MWEHEQALCPQCGRLRSICEDPDTTFNPQIDTCYAALAQRAYSRWWERKFESTKPDADGWHPTDGTMIWVNEQLPPDPAFVLSTVDGEAEVS